VNAWQVSGGAAERDGTVMVGDVIIAVDDREVIGEPLAVLRSLILGQQGSTVKLSLQRREGADVYQYDVKLMRGTAEYFQSLSASRSMEDEIDQLRLQLRQALAHCSQDRDELDRSTTPNPYTLTPNPKPKFYTLHPKP